MEFFEIFVRYLPIYFLPNVSKSLLELKLDEKTSTRCYLNLISQPVSNQNQKFKIGEKDWLKHVVSQSIVPNFFFSFSFFFLLQNLK